MVDDSRIGNKSKDQILRDLNGTAQPGSSVHEQQKMAVIVRCTEDLEKALNNHKESMNNNAESSQKLSNKIFWLNIILASATIIGLLLTIIKFFN